MTVLQSVIIILILVLMVYFIMVIPVGSSPGSLTVQGFEAFTNDEAIQNIASIYNTGNMVVSNLNATSSITTPNLKVTGPITSTSVSDSSMNGTIKSYVDTRIATQLALNATMATQIAGLTRQANAIIIPTKQWSGDGYYYVPLIKAGKYFNTSQPDGYQLNFLFVYPAGGNSTTNFDYWYGQGMKLGKQFFLWKIGEPGHSNVPNPANNVSNWQQYRGDI